MAQPTCLFRAAEIAAMPELSFRHPLNPQSEVHMRALSRLAGLARIGVTLARVGPGRESFVYHYHQREEEFVYILSGRGVADIGDESHEVGPGDCMLFTAPSVGHHLRNPFDEDLVYLMGGESAELEVGEFPRLGKRAVFTREGATIIAVADAVPFAPKGETG
jgi:uncharacterized cupin superfamily protein